MSMNIDQVKQIIDERINDITVTAKTLANAKEIASSFLVAQSLLATFLKDFEDDKAKLRTLTDATFAQAMKRSDEKNVTAKKAEALVDSDYTAAREAFEQIDAIRDYIRTHMKIFENAHLMYRQYSRE